MSAEMFSVEINRSYDILSQKWESHVFLKLYVSLFRSGLVKELGVERAMTLLSIASFMDESGNCYPSQQMIADQLGVTRQTANRWVNSLLDFRWNDKPIIVGKKIRDPRVSPNEYFVYSVLPLSQIAIYEGQIEPVDIQSVETEKPVRTKPRNAKSDILEYFSEKYRETYSVNYGKNYGRDMKLIGTLLTIYDEQQIREIINVVFDEYGDRWANRDYPRPSLGQLNSWLAEKAYVIAQERKQQEERFDTPVEAERSYDDLAKLFGGGAE